MYAEHLDATRTRLGIPPEDLASLAVRNAAQSLPEGIILVGMHTATQLHQCLHDLTPLPAQTLKTLRETGAQIRQAFQAPDPTGTREEEP